MFNSIRYKLGLIFFLSVFVLTLAVVSGLQFHSYRRQQVLERQASEAKIRAAMEATDKWILTKLNTVCTSAYLVEKSGFLDPGLLQKLKEFANENKLRTGVYLGLESGEFIDSSDWVPPKDYVFKERPWYKKVMAEKKPTFVSPYKDAMTGKYTVTFAAPILGVDGSQIRGVIAFDVLLDELNATIGDIFMTDVDQLIYFDLPNANPAMLIRTNNINTEQAKILVDRLSKRGLSAKGTEEVDGARFIIVYGRLAMNNSILIYPVSLNKLMKPILIEALIYFGLTVIGLFVILSIAWYVLGNHIKQIEELNKTTKQVAEGNFDIEIKKTSTDEVGQLADSFNRMILDLKDHIEKLKHTTAAKERMESELRIAREIQMGLVPRNFPPYPDKPTFDIYAMLKSAREVSGDFYDFFFIDDDHFCFVIGDVAGKGVPAAILMAVVKTLIIVAAREFKSPDGILDAVNREISRENMSGVFITIFCGILNIKTGELWYSNGGHNPPLFIHQGKDIKFLQEASSTVVGVLDEIIYEKKKIIMKPNDTIYMYTDGVTEAINAKGEQFSGERLKEEVFSHCKESIQELAKDTMQMVGTFSAGLHQSDDITILILRYFSGKNKPPQ